MIPTHESVHNLKQLILLSQDTRSAEDILLSMLSYTISLRLKSPYSAELEQKTLTIIQVLLEFGIPYKHFEDILIPITSKENRDCHQTFWQRVDHQAMHIKPTHQNIREILRWKSCYKNPLVPSKTELENLIYSIVNTNQIVRLFYRFDEDKYAYVLYWQNDDWHFYDCKKSLTWHFKKSRN